MTESESHTESEDKISIEEVGGDFVANDQNIKGDKVGQNKILGDSVSGDKVLGDKVGGDKSWSSQCNHRNP